MAKIAAYQAPLLPSGSADAIDLIAVQVRACESIGVEFLCCPEGVLSYGSSGIVGREGAVLRTATQLEAGLIVAEIESNAGGAHDEAAAVSPNW